MNKRILLSWLFVGLVCLTGCHGKRLEVTGIIVSVGEEFVIRLHETGEVLTVPQDVAREALGKETWAEIPLGLAVSAEVEDGEVREIQLDWEAWDAAQPTGNPSGMVQEKQLFYHGVLYRCAYEEPLGELPTGWTVAFSIAQNGFAAPASEEGEANHIPVGSNVYENPEEAGVLYVLEDGAYARYTESVEKE